jgi:hypothetical protein
VLLIFVVKGIAIEEGATGSIAKVALKAVHFSETALAAA